MTIGIKAGDVVAGKYQIVERIGAGGQAAVYKATSVGTGALVAVKIAHSSLETNLRARWIREAEAAETIASDHVVKVIDSGVDGEIPWVAWEYLTGRNLSEHIEEEGAQGLHWTSQVLRQIFLGLRDMHTKGVVHCDLSPRNVFMVAADLGPHVKLLDFGIAKILGESLAGSTHLVAGSPLWMSPEQLHGRTGVAGQADVWAFGLLGFYMLAGKPFWREVDSLPAYVVQVLSEPRKVASERAREIGAALQIPKAFDAWFAQCTCTEQSKRYKSISEAWRGYQSVYDLGLDLTTAFQDEPALVQPTRWTAGYMSGRRIAGGSLAIAALGVLAFKVVGSTADSPETDVVSDRSTEQAALPPTSGRNGGQLASAPATTGAVPSSTPAPTSDAPRCPVPSGRPPPYVLGAGLLQVASVPQAGRSKDTAAKLAKSRMRKLGAILKERRAQDWLNVLNAYPGQGEIPVHRVVFSDVEPAAGEGMCKWLQCENWLWGCDFMDSRGRPKGSPGAFPALGSSDDAKQEDPGVPASAPGAPVSQTDGGT